MTNAELYQEIKELRAEAIAERQEMRDEIHGLRLELTLFKGKSFGFLTAISIVFTVIGNVGMHLLTKGK